ncbi:MAG TPA: hypothetical protein VGR28_00655 [Candidatus Thermoplasmatota archaeon]|nr:hypothetical protein [Candidatus Thermoplasmatota archaeon]
MNEMERKTRCLKLAGTAVLLMMTFSLPVSAAAAPEAGPLPAILVGPASVSVCYGDCASAQVPAGATVPLTDIAEHFGFNDCDVNEIAPLITDCASIHVPWRNFILFGIGWDLTYTGTLQTLVCGEFGACSSIRCDIVAGQIIGPNGLGNCAFEGIVLQCCTEAWMQLGRSNTVGFTNLRGGVGDWMAFEAHGI